MKVGDAGAAFLTFNASALAIFRRILRWVIALTPIGSAALIGQTSVDQALAAAQQTTEREMKRAGYPK